MAISRSNWIIVWISLEVNLIRFIPIILTIKTSQETEAAISYFLAQALGSALILYSGLALNSLSFHSIFFYILTTALLIKLGAAPCHFWFPKVINLLSWTNCLILSTWQKIAPLILLAYLLPIPFNKLITCRAALSALIGGLLGLNQTHVRSIIAYSSITHIGWIIGALRINNALSCIIYFSFYCLITAPIFLLFKSLNITSSNQFSTLFSNFFVLLSLTILFLSLAGIPPLTGFLPKWLIILLLSDSRPWLLLSLIVGSFINLFFYLNLSLNILISPISASKFSHKLKYSPVTASISFIALSSLGLLPIILYAMTLLY